MGTRRVLVTGLGLVTPAGSGVGRTWASLLAGGRHVEAVPEIPLASGRPALAGVIRGFRPPAGTDRWDRLCQLAAAAGDEACRDAGLPHAGDTEWRRYRAGISVGCSKGGIHSFTRLADMGPLRRANRDLLVEMLLDVAPDAPVRRLAERYCARGPMHASVAACTTGLHAVIRGARFIAEGEADIVLAGAADASIQPLWLAAFDRMGTLATAHAELGPAFAAQPFDAHRRGFVPGEGAAICVLESEASAQRRGVEPVACVAGWGLGSDPTGLVDVDPTGAPLAHVIRRACRQADVRPPDIGCVCGHGTATRFNDAAEVAALRDVFGTAFEQVPVFSIKGAIGHLLGAAGAVEVAIACLASRDRRHPGTSTLLEADPSLLPAFLPPAAGCMRRPVVLKSSLGFGGHLAAAVIVPP